MFPWKQIPGALWRVPELAVPFSPAPLLSHRKGTLKLEIGGKEEEEEVLWELLPPIAFKIPAHFGRGLRYYKCRQKVCLLAAGLGSSSQHTQRTVDHYYFYEFIP